MLLITVAMTSAAEVFHHLSRPTACVPAITQQHGVGGGVIAVQGPLAVPAESPLVVVEFAVPFWNGTPVCRGST